MSAQFGVWHFDGKRAERTFLSKAREVIGCYGPDSGSSYVNGSLAMLYHAFWTTKESRSERQPIVSPHSTAMTWDGLLDNREELLVRLRDEVAHDASDAAIVMAAYQRWDTNCLPKLIGDWAVAIWDAREQALVLGKDFVGVRHLYYWLDRECIVWSSVLEPLVLLARRPFALDTEFLAGYLGYRPSTRLTAYQGIYSVPPGTFVKVKDGRATIDSYWSFDPRRRVRYKTDAEYEEHFRTILADSVRRRLRSDSPVLAELSGGMDSSSVVCMADQLIAGGKAEAPRLDTISYYDDREPNWNERPYFVQVEKKRGRPGFHLDVNESTSGPFTPLAERSFFCPLPGFDQRAYEFARKKQAYIATGGHRVLLSGIGGDENLGGVPTPVPELADLLVQGRFLQVIRQLKAWSLIRRRPWIHLLFETIQDFLPAGIARSHTRRIAPWLHPKFQKQHRAALLGFVPRSRVLGPLPSFQSNVQTLALLQGQLACSIPNPVVRCDVRYPYLDRDLLEFLYAIPRDQILRPGQRRSLMRRALAGVVPDEILNRKRKAYVSRAPLADIESAWPRIRKLCGDMVSVSLGLIDMKRFTEALEQARHGQADHLVPLLVTLGLELWLQDVSGRGVLEVAPDDMTEKAPPVHKTSRNVAWTSPTFHSAECHLKTEGGE